MDSKPRFLIVDDDPDTCTLLCAILNSLGCDSMAVSGGDEALNVLRDEKSARAFDAVFLDIMMPGLNGFEVLQILKESAHANWLPVIMLTAKDKGNDIINGYRHGADYYIPKPFTKSQVIYGLDIVLGNEEDREKERIPVVEIPEG